MKHDKMIQYWAHMIDESRHESYYDMYMIDHPEDKLWNLVEEQIEQFFKCLKKDAIDINECIKDGYFDEHEADRLIPKMKTKYYWHRIKPQTYAAIISRMTALLSRSKNQRFNEDDDYLSQDNISRLVSRKTIEQCLDIICHNTNVLIANNHIINELYKDFHIVKQLFNKYGIPSNKSSTDHDNESYSAAIYFYKAWAAYAKGTLTVEPYVCDSDNGPELIVKVLKSVEYSADDVDLIVALNKALDIVHFRSDLASAFIEGGKNTCAMVSNLPNGFVV